MGWGRPFWIGGRMQYVRRQDMKSSDDRAAQPMERRSSVRDRRIPDSERYRLIIEGQIIIDGRQSPMVVTNLSSRGLGGRLNGKLAQGEKVTVGLASIGVVDAVVAWFKGNRFGLQLSSTIDPSKVVPTHLAVQTNRRRR